TYIPHGSVSCTSLVTSLFTLLQPPCSRLCPYTTLFRSQPRSDAATLLATHTTQKPRRTRPQLLNLRNRPNLGLPRTPPPLRRLPRLYLAVSHHVHELNAEFTEPLPANEAHQIATSIHKWITTQSRMWADGPTVYEATFTTIQAARGRKSGESRRSDKRETVFDLIKEGKL